MRAFTFMLMPRAAPPRAAEKHSDAGPGLPPFLRTASPTDIQRAPAEEAEARRDVAPAAHVARLLPDAIEVLRGLVRTTTFADWMVPLLTPLSERVTYRAADGVEAGGGELSVGFPGTPRRFSLRLVLDDRADSKLDGLFESSDGSGRIVLYPQRLAEATAADVARVLYHEFIHLFSLWFGTRGISEHLPRTSPAVRARLGAAEYRDEIAALMPHVRAIARAVMSRRSAGATPLAGLVVEYATSLVNETVAAAETYFMSRVSTGISFATGEVHSLEIDDETAIDVGAGVVDYLFESGLMFAADEKVVLTSDAAAAEAAAHIRRILGGISFDYLTLRVGTERAIRAR